MTETRPRPQEKAFAMAVMHPKAAAGAVLAVILMAAGLVVENLALLAWWLS